VSKLPLEEIPLHRQGNRAIAVAATIAIVASLLVAVPSLAVEPVEVVFPGTGAEQSFTVPDGVTSLHIVAIGASGGISTSAGGGGAIVAGDISVTPGSTLYVEVGLSGFLSDAGWNGGGSSFSGGGGGGGASDIRTLSNVEGGSLGSRLLIAAGGGGGGKSTQQGDSPGGDAGEQGGGGGGGYPGTSTGGGAGGQFEGGGGGGGGGGSLGQGGDGFDILGDGAGGGGGGGLYGGGGGGCSQECGGGGGGSSYIGNATNASVGIDTGGVPSVTISYELPPSADLAVALTAPATASRSLAYAITLTNFGPDTATNLVMTDALPAGTTFESATVPAGWNCMFLRKGRGGTVSCTVASLAANASDPASLVIRLAGSAKKAGSISNTATVTSDTHDPDPANNSATAITTIAR
jgi:uncharacterized repeat protein (TIGR01451 family)